MEQSPYSNKVKTEGSRNKVKNEGSRCKEQGKRTKTILNS